MQLEQRTHWIRQGLKASGLPLISSSSHLIAVQCDTVEEAYHTYNALLEQEILSDISIIEQENKEAYLLFAINAYHIPDELSTLVQAFEIAHRPLA